ncbi:integral membrane family protein [Stagonosporopsis vannaccii]|nr:integral membrane family protein [Stagonosporopsis vannaccii]
MADHVVMSRQAGGPPLMPLRSPEYLAEDLAPHLLAVTGSLFALAMITVFARFYVRIFQMKIFGWDDVMMTISAALSTSCLGLFVKLIALGLGRHAEAFPLKNVFPFFKFIYFYSILIIFAYSFIKLSIGFFLLRLADRTKWRPFLIGVLVFIGCFTIGSTFAIIFQCTPVAAGWDYNLRPPTGDGKCYDATIFKNVGVFNSSVNIATDLLFALIPIPMVWKLQVNLRTRIGLAIVLSLGLFASAVAIYKTPMQANFFKETDWSGHGAWYYIWQQVEMNVGIIAANLPTLKPLFANFFGHMRTFTKGRSTGSRSGPGLSGPFKSNGYYKHNDERHMGTGVQSSYAMRDISGATESKKKDSYDEILVLGKESYGVDAGRSRRQSVAGASEESVFVHEGPRSPAGPMSPRSGGLGRNFTITKTTEVRVSKSVERQ